MNRHGLSDKRQELQTPREERAVEVCLCGIGGRRRKSRVTRRDGNEASSAKHQSSRKDRRGVLSLNRSGGQPMETRSGCRLLPSTAWRSWELWWRERGDNIGVDEPVRGLVLGEALDIHLCWRWSPGPGHDTQTRVHVIHVMRRAIVSTALRVSV